MSATRSAERLNLSTAIRAPCSLRPNGPSSSNGRPGRIDPPMPRTADRLPTMLFNVNDWLTSKSVVRMTYEQRGMYLELLLFAWLDDEPGVLSADDETLAGILRIPVDEWACHSGPIGRAWDTVSRPGFWVQKRMVEEHARQVKFLERQRDLGARGAEKRWGQRIIRAHRRCP